MKELSNRTACLIIIADVVVAFGGASMLTMGILPGQAALGGPKKGQSNTNQPIKVPPPVVELGTESQAMQKAMEAMGIEALAIHEVMNDGQNTQYRRRIKANGLEGYLKWYWSTDTDGKGKEYTVAFELYIDGDKQ